jgi:hypothetical protein
MGMEMATVARWSPLVLLIKLLSCRIKVDNTVEYTQEKFKLILILMAFGPKEPFYFKRKWLLDASKGQSHESNNTPRSTDSCAKPVSNIDSYSQRYSATNSLIFHLILLPWGWQDHLWSFLCYTVALTAVTKAETLVFSLYTVQKNSALQSAA